MPRIKVLAFAGSTRKESFNKKLIQAAIKNFKHSEAEVTFLDLKDHLLPIYDGDLEAEGGLPQECIKLKRIFEDHDAFLISSPEYNGSITPILKNTIDWLSRPAPNKKPLECFDGKVAALLSASPGALGGLRGLVHIRAILGNIKVLVIPDQIALPKAHEAFGSDGLLRDAKMQKSIEDVVANLVKVTLALK